MVDRKLAEILEPWILRSLAAFCKGDWPRAVGRAPSDSRPACRVAPRRTAGKSQDHPGSGVKVDGGNPASTPVVSTPARRGDTSNAVSTPVSTEAVDTTNTLKSRPASFLD
jgi:hypothetical protein